MKYTDVLVTIDELLEHANYAQTLRLRTLREQVCVLIKEIDTLKNSRHSFIYADTDGIKLLPRIENDNVLLIHVLAVMIGKTCDLYVMERNPDFINGYREALNTLSKEVLKCGMMSDKH